MSDKEILVITYRRPDINKDKDKCVCVCLCVSVCVSVLVSVCVVCTCVWVYGRVHTRLLAEQKQCIYVVTAT